MSSKDEDGSTNREREAPVVIFKSSAAAPQLSEQASTPQPASSTGSSSKSSRRKAPDNKNRPKVSQAQPVHLKKHYEWQNLQEMSFRLSNLPAQICSTLELYKHFSKYGSILRIEVFENTSGSKDGNARIRFSPPPTEMFWTPPGFYTLSGVKGTSTCQVKVHAEKSKRKFEVESPIRRKQHYPEQMKMQVGSLEVGVLLQEKTMMAMSSLTSTQPHNIVFLIDLLRKHLSISFSYQINDPANVHSRLNHYMFQIPFDHLSQIKSIEEGDNGWSLILSLSSPPPYFRRRTDVEKSHSDDSLIWADFDSWFRQTEIEHNPRTLHKTMELHNEDAIIDIGQWLTYRFSFPKTNTEAKKTFLVARQALADFNVEIINVTDFTTVPGQSSPIWSLMGSEALHIPFEVRYQLEVCISRGVINEHNLDREFITQLSNLVKEDKIKARGILEFVAERGNRIYEPLSLFKNEAALSFLSKFSIPYYCVWLRKATITPTTLYYSTPTVETSNRVIRKFSKYSDRFLRVQFTDEITEGRINPTNKERNDALFIRIYRTLVRGISIGDRHYEFLAFGNSQFRENGAYFFCPADDLSCDDIRNWMGDFRHISVVAKYAARLGQCFSTTRAINNAINVKISEIPDIERNGYCFTDGVGKISQDLAKEISAELGFSGESIPSAVQFRLGGCKGVLVVSPDVKGTEVQLRKSQAKFRAVYNGLEIIRASRYTPAALNRQTITILSALGVEDEIFHQLLAQQLQDYEQAMTDSVMTIRFLGRYLDENHMTLTLANMITDGFMKSQDPFFMSLLHLWRTWSIKLLKEKAKLIVEKGAFLLGCVDETSTLQGHFNSLVEPDKRIHVDKLPQIFLQIPDRKYKGRYVVIEGICLVGRNPSLHPGDLRIVNAVNSPKLHHLRDVVVFPQLGDRDVPGMCSGGDLDGDDFFVIWDEDLIPPRWNIKPMDYTAPQPEQLDRPVQVIDLMRFFVRYMKNDTLPSIAHAHLAQSDFLDKGVNDPKCLELAALHSKAVDYVKTGEPAEMEKRLRPRQWPHFMEKRHKARESTYNSGKILGQLYDKVDRVDFAPQYKCPFDVRILRAYKHEDHVLKTARVLKKEYDGAMKRIMAHHEIASEFEVWSTFVLSRHRVGSDYKMQEIMEHVSSGLKDRYRSICIEKAGGKEHSTLGPFVAAMYRVTWQEMEIALHECSTTQIVGGRQVPCRKMDNKYMPLMSFPWLFPEVLGRIATGRRQEIFVEDLSFLHNHKPASKKKPDVSLVPVKDSSVVVETTAGVTHAGEVLEVFKSDEDSDEVSTPSTAQSQKNKDEALRLVDLDFEESANLADELLLTADLSSNSDPYENGLNEMIKLVDDTVLDVSDQPSLTGSENFSASLLELYGLDMTGEERDISSKAESTFSSFEVATKLELDSEVMAKELKAPCLEIEVKEEDLIEISSDPISIATPMDVSPLISIDDDVVLISASQNGSSMFASSFLNSSSLLDLPNEVEEVSGNSELTEADLNKLDSFDCPKPFDKLKKLFADESSDEE